MLCNVVKLWYALENCIVVECFVGEMSELIRNFGVETEGKAGVGTSLMDNVEALHIYGFIYIFFF